MQIFHNLVLTAAVGSLLVAITPAQVNLVVNGDFEGGTSKNWKMTGYTLGAQVSKFDTAGIGSTLCFNNRPGGQTTPPPYAPNAMEQDILQIQSVEYLFTCDLAIFRSVAVGNADAGTIEVFVNGVSIRKKAFGSYASGTTMRERLCVRYTPQSTGLKTLKITFHRRYLSGQTSPTPTSYIDNISVIQSPNQPILCTLGERKLGGNLDLKVLGTANANFLVMVAVSRLKTGVPIPGFGGLWYLGSPLLEFLRNNTGSTGKYKLLLPIPNLPSLSGVPIHWQAIQAAGSTVTMGVPATFGFYK